MQHLCTGGADSLTERTWNLGGAAYLSRPIETQLKNAIYVPCDGRQQFPAREFKS